MNGCLELTTDRLNYMTADDNILKTVTRKRRDVKNFCSQTYEINECVRKFTVSNACKYTKKSCYFKSIKFGDWESHPHGNETQAMARRL